MSKGNGDLFGWDSGQAVAMPELALNVLYFNQTLKDISLYRGGGGLLQTNAQLKSVGLLTTSHIYVNSASARLYFYSGSAYDVELYRGGANILQTGDSLRIASGLVVGNTTTTPLAGKIIATDAVSAPTLSATADGVLYGLFLGASSDVQLYRGATDILDTPDSMRVGVGMVVGDNTTSPQAGYLDVLYGARALWLEATGDGASYGVRIGSDVVMYRGAANVLDTMDSVRIGAGLVVGDNTTSPVTGKVYADYAQFSTNGSSGGIYIGSDTQIYRGGTNILETLDHFRVNYGLVVGNLSVPPSTGYIVYTAALRSYKNSTEYTGYIYIPLDTVLTSTSWDGDSRSTTSKTLIDLSSVFGAPANIQAVKLRIVMRDSGSASTTSGAYIIFWNNNSNLVGAGLKCNGVANNAEVEGMITIPCTAGGDIYYQCGATGTSTLDVWVQIVGYYI